MLQGVSWDPTPPAKKVGCKRKTPQMSLGQKPHLISRGLRESGCEVPAWDGPALPNPNPADDVGGREAQG